MKKLFLTLCLALCSVFSSIASETLHYKMVYTDLDASISNDVLNYLESNWELYYKYMGAQPFDSKLLNVKLFRSRQTYNEALIPQKLPSIRTDFIYLHYGEPNKNCLYAYYIPAENSEDNKSTLSKKMKMALNRHGFLQYMFSVAPNTPAWFREGSALYFESIAPSFVDLDVGFAGPKALRNNRDYLNNIKDWSQRAPVDLSDILSLDDELFTKNAERNLVYSWGIINYLIISGQENIISEIVGQLNLSDSQATLTENIKNLLITKDFEGKFDEYVANTPTYSDLIENGKKAYSAADLEGAISFFKEAIQARSDLYAAFYYMGLIAYQQRFYEKASQYYKIALNNGAPKPLIDYNLGFIAYKLKDFTLAGEYFEKAKKADGTRYGASSDAMIKQIEADKIIDAAKPATASANGQAVPTDMTPPSTPLEMPTEF